MDVRCDRQHLAAVIQTGNAKHHAAVQVLSENAELSSRLIDVALTSDNNVFDAVFSNDSNSSSHSKKDGIATVPLGHWSQEEAKKRRQEAEDEVRCCYSRHISCLQ